MRDASQVHKGHSHSGAPGGAGAAAAYLVNTLRSAGVRRVGDLYREALADPELARTLISKMPAAADSGKLHTLARLLTRSLIVGPMLQRQTPAPDPAPSYTPPAAPTPTIHVPVGHPILRTSRQAPDGFYYVKDPRQEGRFMRVSG